MDEQTCRHTHPPLATDTLTRQHATRFVDTRTRGHADTPRRCDTGERKRPPRGGAYTHKIHKQTMMFEVSCLFFPAWRLQASPQWHYFREGGT